MYGYLEFIVLLGICSGIMNLSGNGPCDLATMLADAYSNAIVNDAPIVAVIVSHLRILYIRFSHILLSYFRYKAQQIYRRAYLLSNQ